MSATGRLSRVKGGDQAKADFLGTQSGPEVARAARIAELRRLVATGRYKVEPVKLASRIMARALRDQEK